MVIVDYYMLDNWFNRINIIYFYIIYNIMEMESETIWKKKCDSTTFLNKKKIK